MKAQKNPDRPLLQAQIRANQNGFSEFSSETDLFIGSSAAATRGGRSDPARLRRRRNRTNSRSLDLLRQTMAEKVNSDGLAALARKPVLGVHPNWHHDNLRNLKSFSNKVPKRRAIFRIVADLIRKKFHVDYCRSNVRKILNDIGFSYHKHDVKSTKFSQQAVDEWRKHVWPRLKKSRWQQLRPDFVGRKRFLLCSKYLSHLVICLCYANSSWNFR